ncbi:MAG: VCBS repeat-containing protein [Chitinophagaceae bacterium]
MLKLVKLSSFISFLLFFSCHQKEANPVTLFQLMDSTGIDFNNKVVDQQLDNSFLFRNFYNGGGVAIGDINNDGLADIFLTSNMGENKLYLNKGNFKFEDISAKAGLKQDNMWSTGVVFVDINNDGWQDIYVCNSGHMSNGNRKNKLYINNHNLQFTESAHEYGLDISAYTTQVSFFDYDNDGDLDCFMINNSPIPVNTLKNSNRRDLPDSAWNVKPFLKGGGDHMFRNDNGHFSEVTQSIGIHGSLISFGLGASVGDINGDGYLDIYVSNDSYERDYLYINQKNGTFKDDLENCMGHTSFSSMGTDMADVNNDGYPDIFSTDMLPGDDYRLKTLGAFDNIDLYNSKLKAGFYRQFMQNCLQVNNRNGQFMEVANFSGVEATDWSWGALIFDADNDGLNDIYVCNGVNKDVTNLDFMDFFADTIMQRMVLEHKKDSVEKLLDHIPVNGMPNKAFKNMGNLQFSDATNVWGFNTKSFSNGAAYGDLDNDGDLDLIVNNENMQAFVYKNNSREQNHNNYITIQLKGDEKNITAIGSLVKVYAGKQLMIREQVPSRGFQSCVDNKLLIGLGKIPKIDSIVVRWPNRTYSVIHDPAVNKTLNISQLETPSLKPGVEKLTQTFFQELTNNFDKHKEDDYTDFYYERNIPVMISREGPRAAVGDVNGDGLEDVYIGGAVGQAGQLYLQSADGNFTKKPEKVFDEFANFEDVAVLFFDADKDGDLDLVIGPGGNNQPPNSREIQLRLYKNDGHGNFEIDAAAFPVNDADISTIVASDFNNDGFQDLFVGAGNAPRDYGVSPSSMLLQNDGHGHFTNLCANVNKDIAQMGMVKSAVWADVLGNGHEQLIVVGEWMTPRIFSYQGNRFVEVKTNLSQLFGWWRCVIATDVNGDGKQDLVMGNIGENFYLRPDSAHPVKLFIGDFDKNNEQTEKILTRSYEGKDVPVFLKREMTDQFPVLKKKNLKHVDYANKSVEDLFGKDAIKKADVKVFNFKSSVVAINNGNGQFTIEKLPLETQLSSLNSILPIGLNGGGQKLLAAGNEFSFQPQFGCLDANYGQVLQNNGKGVFSCMDQHQCGLGFKGAVRDLKLINTRKGKKILVLQNDEKPILLQMKEGDNK